MLTLTLYFWPDSPYTDTRYGTIRTPVHSGCPPSTRLAAGPLFAAAAGRDRCALADGKRAAQHLGVGSLWLHPADGARGRPGRLPRTDRKSTRLNSSHQKIS